MRQIAVMHPGHSLTCTQQEDKNNCSDLRQISLVQQSISSMATAVTLELIITQSLK